MLNKNEDKYKKRYIIVKKYEYKREKKDVIVVSIKINIEN